MNHASNNCIASPERRSQRQQQDGLKRYSGVQNVEVVLVS